MGSGIFFGKKEYLAPPFEKEKMKKIIDYLNSNRNNIIEFTKDLIGISTVNPPGKNYDKLVRLVERECKAAGLRTKRYAVPTSYLREKGITEGAERINLIADWNTNSKKTLHITCHYDVVPATGNWKTPPFRPVVNKGRIYGRGAEDMKGNIASVIFAIKALKVNNLAPRVNVQLSFCPDEETGGATGFGWLVKKDLIKADYAISEGYSGEWVACGNKGVAWFDIEVFGKSAHASSPYRGINSFEKMVKVASALFDLKKRIEKKKTKFVTRNKLDKAATLVMGGELKGGLKVNTVPDLSVFSIDRRLLPEETMGEAIKEIKNVISDLKKKDKDLRVNVKLRSGNNAVTSGTDNALFQAFKRAAIKVKNKRVKEAILSGATDLRFLIVKGVPCLGYSAKGGEKWHSDNEYVIVKSLIETSQILSHTILYLS